VQIIPVESTLITFLRRFLSLAGVGDLFLTCSSEKSRNFTVGHRLGKGEKLDEILSSLGSVAEGVDTAKS